MIAALRADILKLRKRPAAWVLIAIWTALTVFFGYIVPALIVNAEFIAEAAGAREMLMVAIVPAGFVSSSLEGLPLFGFAIVVIFAGLAVGSEYGWGTVSQTLVQRPTRTAVYLGRTLALALVAALFTVLTFVLSAISSAIVAAAFGEPLEWPTAWTVVRGLAASWLILAVAAALAICIATVLRSTALAVGLGLVYVAIVEQLFSGFAGLSSVVENIAMWLPGVNAGSLAASFAAGPASTVTESGATVSNQAPGVSNLVSAEHGVAVLCIYAVVLVAIGLAVFVRRDVATS